MDYGPFGDPQFWKDVGRSLDSPYRSLQEFGKIPAKADDLAEREFPGSARDSSTKNAFRHALGTGMVAQQLGGGVLGAAAAKGAGYVWEGLGALDKRFWSSPEYRQDSLHDLNANAVGAATALKVANQEELVQALKRLALDAAPVQAPGVFSASPGYLTRTVR